MNKISKKGADLENEFFKDSQQDDDEGIQKYGVDVSEPEEQKEETP